MDLTNVTVANVTSDITDTQLHIAAAQAGLVGTAKDLRDHLAMQRVANHVWPQHLNMTRAEALVRAAELLGIL